MQLPRPIRIVFSLYAMIIFLALMFLLFPLAVLGSLFGKKVSGRFIYAIVTFWADAAMFFWGMRHINIYEEEHDPSRPVIFVFNHVSYMDIPVLLKAFRHQPIRVLGKAEMSSVPVFGYMYRQAVILVKRDSPANRAKSLQLLKEAIQDNISVVIAPEGTFNMTGRPLKEFYDGAFRIAIETQTPIRPVIFLDTYDRMHYRSIFSMTPGRSRAVYLPVVPVKGYDLSDLPALKQKVYDRMEKALIQYGASWIREDNK